MLKKEQLDEGSTVMVNNYVMVAALCDGRPLSAPHYINICLLSVVPIRLQPEAVMFFCVALVRFIFYILCICCDAWVDA